MHENSTLRNLFDDKLLSILNVFLEKSTQTLSLSEIANASRVNIATTFRQLDKLVNEQIISTVVIGKSKFYRLNNNERVLALSKVLGKDEPLNAFVNAIHRITPLKKVILEDKTEKSLKLILVGEKILPEQLTTITQAITSKFGVKIDFVVISTQQYRDMNKMDIFDLKKKVIWER